jgi:PTS system mannose-specific IIC component
MSVIFASLKITMVTYAILGTLIAAIFVLVKRDINNRAVSTGPMETNDFDDDDDDF